MVYGLHPHRPISVHHKRKVERKGVGNRVMLRGAVVERMRIDRSLKSVVTSSDVPERSCLVLGVELIREGGWWNGGDSPLVKIPLVVSRSYAN